MDLLSFVAAALSTSIAASVEPIVAAAATILEALLFGYPLAAMTLLTLYATQNL